MNFSAIIFDVDGTLADTESVQLKALNMLLNPLGVFISQEEWARHYVGIPIEQDILAIHQKYNLKIPLQNLSDERRALYSKLVKQKEYLYPADGLVSLLDELDARDIPYGVASGSPGHDIRDVLATLGLASRFRVIAAGNEVTNPKPAPDVYLKAAERLKIEPFKCVAIEDSASGIAAAKAAGMRTLAIPSAFTRFQDLNRADMLLEDFVQVKSWLFPPNK